MHHIRVPSSNQHPLLPHQIIGSFTPQRLDSKRGISGCSVPPHTHRQTQHHERERAQKTEHAIVEEFWHSPGPGLRPAALIPKAKRTAPGTAGTT